jgi:hypothetical protein
MNYIEDLMKKNDINIGQHFAIIGGEKYNAADKIFYFDSYYRLRSKYGSTTHDSIFVKLMTGEYKIIK